MAWNTHRLLIGGLSDHGIYHLRGLPGGVYHIAFAACSIATARYAVSYWHNAQTRSVANYLRLSKGQILGGINQVMPIGGVITGTVTDTANMPLPGICVGVFSPNSFGGPGTSTDSHGRYQVIGLSTGTYQLQFFPGCNNNGNYLAVTYPKVLRVKDGTTRAGINVTLLPGATLSGVVTSAATKAALAGICVGIIGVDSHGIPVYFNMGASRPDGSYMFNQMPAGEYAVQFTGGCGNQGSYAPQAYNSPSVFFPQPVDVTVAGQTVTGIDAAMQPGATISGTVTDTSGHKLSQICALPIANGVVWGQGVSANGRYAAANLPPAQYQVLFLSCPTSGSGPDLVGIYYGNQISQANAPFVSASVGTTSGIDAALPAGGGFSGDVLTKSGKAVDTSCLYLFGLSGAAQTESVSGIVFGDLYQVSGLPPGPYAVAFVPSCAGHDLATQWYKGKTSMADATHVNVAPGHNVPGIDSALVKGGSITGTVTFGAKPVRDMCVFAQSTSQFLDYGFGQTNAAGQYDVQGLNSGQYELQMSPCGPSSQIYAAEVLPKVVFVHAPNTTTAINASALLGGSISGKVLGGSPAMAQPGICVDAIPINGFGGSSTSTLLDGSFQLTGLLPGQYAVFINDTGCALTPDNFESQWYPGVSAPQLATKLNVTAGANIALSSVTLPTDGSITGTVTRSGNVALPGICVIARTGGGALPVYAVTGHNGSYSIIGLTAGTYRIEFRSGCGATGYQIQWWKNKSSQLSADPVHVTDGTTNTGISAVLHK